MSKKDLLERLTRAPGEPSRTRRKAAKEPASTPRKAASTPVQRVGNRVLRRTRRGEGAATPPAPAAEDRTTESRAVVRRRPASEIAEEAAQAAAEAEADRATVAPEVEAAPEPARAEVEPESAPAPPQVAATEAEPALVAAPEPVAAPESTAPVEPPVVEAPEPPAQAAPAPAVDEVSDANASRSRAPSPEPEQSAPEAPASVEKPEAPVKAAPDAPSKPAPAEPVGEAPAAPAAVEDGAAAGADASTDEGLRIPDREPRRVVASRHQVRRRKRQSATTRPADAAPEAPEAAPPVPDAPPPTGDDRKVPGLGSAVVVPPPNYDPSNPNAYRRQQEATPAPAPAGAAAGAASAKTRGRRRVESGGGGGGDYRGRRQNRGRGGGRGYDRRPSRKPRRRSGPKQASPAPKASKRKVRVDNVISVRDLGMQLGVKATIVLRQLMDLGMMVNVNDLVDIETAALVAAEFEYEVENVGFQEHNYLENVEEAVEEENLQERPPVVTIMGHVDHGKTTLLDTIRRSRVASGEAGGITQHIGAYQVEANGQSITFIDTPGHQAFTAMRARGAGVTDIVVLVVAADDGVQPQTEEAIAHARAADVPIIVAVNKMDKPGVTAEAIMTRLSEYELVPEEWGGDTLFVPISALKNEGIDDLLDAIVLQAEVVDIRANPDRFAEGIVLEAKMERGRGAVASALIQHGTLKRGDHVVLGSAFGKVRAMLDSNGKNIKEAGPSTPVELFGLSELPEVGDTVNAVKSEKNARTLAEHRAVAKRQELVANSEGRRTAADLYAKAAEEQMETLLLILKADVGGSLQAVKAAVEDIEVDGARVRILLANVGDINESDVNLAASDNARLIGFNVKVDARARKSAQQLGVEPELYTIIYEVLDRVEREMKGMLAPVYELVREGTIEVRQLFRISRIGTVAGSYVIDGKVGRNHQAKVLREGKEIWEGKIDTLKRFKDDVREVAAGYECGVSLEGFDDLEIGDLIETYSEQVVEPT